MGTIIDKINAWGGDMRGAIDRCMGNEEIYLDCLNILITDIEYINLGAYIISKDYGQAIICARSLKEVSLNMGLMPIYSVLKSITDTMKERKPISILALYELLKYKLEELKNIVAKFNK